MPEIPETEPPSDEPPRKRGGGPPLGSTNAIRHGLTAGKLPRNLAHVENRINGFRRKLEARVIAAKGEITINDAASVNSACKWERHGLLALYWLTKEAATMPVSERLRFSEAAAKASDARDKNIRALGLDVPPTLNWIIDQ